MTGDMRFWWVNQNQTFEQETSGGYLWSPKRNANGARNPFYESMREVAPGDLIFSFKDTFIPSFGIAQSYCYECPKPVEFGKAGVNWQPIGWKVDVNYQYINEPLRPRDHMEILRPILPAKYSPLQDTGRGNQGVYLTELPPEFSDALVKLIGREAQKLLDVNRVAETEFSYKQQSDGLSEWEDHIKSELEGDTEIPETERKALVKSRVGQGRFKMNVAQIEHRCRITKVDRIEHLRASHLKPWRDSSNNERLDGENGLLLTPTIDHLFDRGFISFEDNGLLLVSPVAHTPSLEKMGVSVSGKTNVGSFVEGQKQYLEFHRENIFLERR